MLSGNKNHVRCIVGAPCWGKALLWVSISKYFSFTNCSAAPWRVLRLVSSSWSTFLGPFTGWDRGSGPSTMCTTMHMTLLLLRVGRLALHCALGETLGESYGPTKLTWSGTMTDWINQQQVPHTLVPAVDATLQIAPGLIAGLGFVHGHQLSGQWSLGLPQTPLIIGLIF